MSDRWRWWVYRAGKGGGTVLGHNGIELGVYARLNTLGGAKQACIMHNRKQGRR
jgi:hypothetical protein